MPTDATDATEDNRPPRLRDVVTSRARLEPYEQRPGVVTDIYSLSYADRYRVEYRDGDAAWYWADGITVDPAPFDLAAVSRDLATARDLLYRALIATERHDVLSSKLSAVFDQVTALGRTYLGIDFHDTGGVYRPADAPEAHHPTR
jgi:hypothetical protein